MKKQLLILLILILSINSYSQITFEKGYYIHNSGQKVDCLIKNYDWKNNPINLEYKVSENDELKTISLKSIKEFAIYNISKYIKKIVAIDRSSESIHNLSQNKNPIFNKEELFLKVLVEGQADLFFYEDGRLKRYFYKLEDSNVEQLIFKSYINSNNEIGKNNGFKQQLWKDLKCSTIKMKSVENLEYKKNSLIKFFSQYNKCSNSDFIDYEEKQKRDFFNLTLRPRIRNSSLTIRNNSTSSRDIEFGNKLGFGLGVEAEFILPYNNNKWAILIEPTYQNFKAKKTTNADNVSGGKLISEVKYNSIEIPISLRYYIFLNSNSKLFINTSLIIDYSLESSIELMRADNSTLKSLEIKTGSNLAIGIGYKLNDKFVLETRFQTSRNVLGTYAFWNSDYKTVSVIFGYTLF